MWTLNTPAPRGVAPIRGSVPVGRPVSHQLAAHPAGSYDEARAACGNGDSGSVIGHSIYDRYGCSKKFMKRGEDQSGALISKDRTGDSVSFLLKPKALAAPKEIGVI